MRESLRSGGTTEVTDGEYVWIAGLSRVGKATLIERLAKPSETALRQQCGLTDKVKVFLPSLEGGRSWRLSDLPSPGGTHVLVKWQFATHARLHDLLRANARCRLLCLLDRYDGIAQRRRHSSRPYDHHDRAVVATEWNKLKTFLDRIHAGGLRLPLAFVRCAPGYPLFNETDGSHPIDWSAADEVLGL